MNFYDKFKSKYSNFVILPKESPSKFGPSEYNKFVLIFFEFNKNNKMII